MLAQSSSHGSDCMIQVSNHQQEDQNEEDKLKNQDDLIPTSSSHETDLQQQQQVISCSSLNHYVMFVRKHTKNDNIEI